TIVQIVAVSKSMILHDNLALILAALRYVPEFFYRIDLASSGDVADGFSASCPPESPSLGAERSKS
ncbi:MAG: hypothetical protein WBV62_07490, partial [Roseobacter sp.]